MKPCPFYLAIYLTLMTSFSSHFHCLQLPSSGCSGKPKLCTTVSLFQALLYTDVGVIIQNSNLSLAQKFSVVPNNLKYSLSTTHITAWPFPQPYAAPSSLVCPSLLVMKTPGKHTKTDLLSHLWALAQPAPPAWNALECSAPLPANVLHMLQSCLLFH